MQRLPTLRFMARLLMVSLAVAAACRTPARASVISATPTLPLLGVPYASSVGAGCFPAQAVCIQPGTLTLTSVVPPGVPPFNAAGQDIVANATYSGIFTDASNTPLGVVTLTGTVEQEILGRTTSTQTGTWATELLSLSMSGPFMGHTLSISLSSSSPSTGVTSIIPITGSGPDEGMFQIDSSFDVFIDLTLDTQIPLHTTRGPITFAATAAAVPEPAGLGILAIALLGFAMIARRVA
jgi:hypothetical protein